MSDYTRKQLDAMKSHKRLVREAKNMNKLIEAGFTVSPSKDWQGYFLDTCPKCNGFGYFVGVRTNANCDYCQETGLYNRRGMGWVSNENRKNPSHHKKQFKLLVNPGEEWVI